MRNCGANDELYKLDSYTCQPCEKNTHTHPMKTATTKKGLDQTILEF